MEQRKSLMRNQEGFTLIEIIAVLVLLGILAAVAVPKYFDLQETAKLRAADAAVAEGVAIVTQAYAAAFMIEGKAPTVAKTIGQISKYNGGADTVVDKVEDVPAADFLITFTADGNTGIEVAAKFKDATDYPASGPGYKLVHSLTWGTPPPSP